jgi:hypothetical protein
MDNYKKVFCGSDLVRSLENKEHELHLLHNSYPPYVGTKENNDVVRFIQYCRTAGFYGLKELLERCDIHGYGY